MTKIDLQDFEQQREKACSPPPVVVDLRSTAQDAEDFAKLISGIDVDGKGKRKEFVFDDGDGSKKRKRSVKPKDPNAPRRPASSYILFQNEKRAKLREENPQLSNAEILHLCSEMWKNADDETREEFNQKQLVEKARYEVDKKAWDSRTPAQVAAAEKATAEAAASKKANKGGRSKKDPAPVAAVQVRPPPPEVDSDEDAETGDDSEEESNHEVPAARVAKEESSEEESDSEESEPAPKRKRGASAQPKPVKGIKKPSKA
ncbi:hypothetical protein EST38_g1617 [Candolleomyces aberdarensis]|uniref:HMG box domain-containing protein n=1 Tax=Candolleomyces aberdarensis TaxID=2316362 RepID=A0A4Q2DYZ5_9AGAR|nr:hypothetical protein EST38_g1617 [Candolleomyces aberdarensis]